MKILYMFINNDDVVGEISIALFLRESNKLENEMDSFD